MMGQCVCLVGAAMMKVHFFTSVATYLSQCCQNIGNLCSFAPIWANEVLDERYWIVELGCHHRFQIFVPVLPQQWEMSSFGPIRVNEVLDERYWIVELIYDQCCHNFVPVLPQQ